MPLARIRSWLACALLAGAVGVVVVIGSIAITNPRAVDARNDPGAVPPPVYLAVDKSLLRRLPTSGAAWTAIVRTADGDLGRPDLAEQNNRNAGRTLAAALVFARTGDETYRDKVRVQLDALPATIHGARVLSVGRQLAGYVIAADLVEHRTPEFLAFVWDLRTRELGGHGRWRSLSQTSEETATNWGTWALASRIAASAYIGDSSDLAKAAMVFKGFLGDRRAHTGFRPSSEFDPTWVCGDDELWVPINPAECGDKAGAIVEDVSRSAGTFPVVDDVGRMYMWEVLGGAFLSAELLSRQGYPDVYAWSDEALLRAALFVRRTGTASVPYAANKHIPWMVYRAYDVQAWPLEAAGFGRQYGYTDWLP